NVVSVQVDTAAVPGTLSLLNFTDSGTAGDFISNDKSFDLSLAGNEAGTVVYQASTNGGSSWATTTAAQSNLADGSYQFRAVVTDPAGNSSTTTPISVIVDNTAPTAGTLSFVNLIDTGSDDTPDITTDGTFSLNLAGNLDA